MTLSLDGFLSMHDRLPGLSVDNRVSKQLEHVKVVGRRSR